MGRRKKFVFVAEPGRTRPNLEPPPPQTAPIWPRAKIGGGDSFTGFFLSRSLLGIDTHYTKDGYMPCARMFGTDCPYHCSLGDGGRRTIWLSPTPAWSLERKRVELVQITAGSVQAHPGLARRTDLYGRQFSLGRIGKGIRGQCHLRMLLERADWVGDGKEIEHDLIWTVLEQLWGFERIEGGPAAGSPLQAEG